MSLSNNKSELIYMKQVQQQLNEIQKNYLRQNTTQMILFVLSISISSFFNNTINKIINKYISEEDVNKKIIANIVMFVVLFSITIGVASYLELGIR